MIFVTVGGQMPFDRLVQAVDGWAGAGSRPDVFAQIGPTSYRPVNLRWTPFLQPAEFKEHVARAKLVVAHAGTGSILTALQLGKPILVMPRRAALRETRNDHQVATAAQFRRFSSVFVAEDEKELVARLEGADELTGRRRLGPYASRSLIDALRQFVVHGVAPAGAVDALEEWEEGTRTP